MSMLAPPHMLWLYVSQSDDLVPVLVPKVTGINLIELVIVGAKSYEDILPEAAGVRASPVDH